MTAHPTRTKRRAVIAGLALFVSAFVPVASQATAAGLNAGGEYHPLVPTRIYDNVNVPLDAGGGRETTIQLLGANGVVPTDPDAVLAVLANVTVDRAPSAGYLNSYPAGVGDPGSSNLNFRPGQPVANVVLLRPGASGQTTFKLVGGGAGSARLIVDVFGWISSSSYTQLGGRLISTSPSRIVDTRAGTPVGAGQSIPVQIRGAALPGVGEHPERSERERRRAQPHRRQRPGGQRRHVRVRPRRAPGRPAGDVQRQRRQGRRQGQPRVRPDRRRRHGVALQLHRQHQPDRRCARLLPGRRQPRHSGRSRGSAGERVPCPRHPPGAARPRRRRGLGLRAVRRLRTDLRHRRQPELQSVEHRHRGRQAWQHRLADRQRDRHRASPGSTPVRP